MKKLFLILTLFIFAPVVMADIPAVQTEQLRNLRASTQIVTNLVQVIDAITNEIAQSSSGGDTPAECNTAKTTWSHPYSWRIWWDALGDDTQESTVTNVYEISAGRTINQVVYSIIKNNQAKLSFDYLDQINLPQHSISSYSVIDGPAYISNFDTVVGTANGTIQVRATLDDGTYKDTYVNLYQWKDSAEYSAYISDANLNRKRVNDFHLSMLQQYRANPDTNRVYTIWSSDGGVRMVGNTGDVYTGQYGSIWKPYHHKTSNSGGNCSWWWSHAPITKHTLLAADHYGWNNTRTKTEYIGWNSNSDKGVQLTITNYYSLADWAKANNIPEEDWSGCGDIGIHIVKEDIPDQYLPYIASADYLNETYGYGTNTQDYAYIPCISLNQSNMAALRSLLVGSKENGAYTSFGWGGHSGGPTGASTIYDDGVIKDLKFRNDIYQYARLGGWHSVIMGDSGNPVFFYDPALLIDGTDEMRPVLLFAYHFGGGAGGSGPSIPRYTKVLKMFLESIGETLQFTLGDLDNQQANVIKAKE